MKKLIYIAIIMTVFFFLASCGQQEGGLFYSIEQESEISNGRLADNITIGQIVRNNDYYFIAAGKFMYKSVSAKADWPETNVNQNPAGYENYLCYDLALAGNTLYAVFYDKDGLNYSLFTVSTANPSSGMSWSGPMTFTNIPSGERIIGVEALQNRFFVYTSATSNDFNLYSTDASTLSASSAFTTIATDMYASGALSVDFDGTNFWIAVGNKVFSSNSDNSVTTNLTADIMAKSAKLLGNGFSGILCADTQGDSGKEVYLCSEEGVMLMYDGSAWNVILNPADATNGLFAPLYGIEHIVVSNTNEDINIIIAGSSDGYYEIDVPDADDSGFVSPASVDTKLTIKNQFESIDLSNHIIQGFYYDDTTADSEVIFAMTYNGGLWRNSYREINGQFSRFWDIE